MDAKTSIKKRLPSRHVTEGPERAPHRSYLYAMVLTTEQIHQPFVGVASCWNEAAPCNIALMRQAQAVKKGVAAGGGTPREFCTITVTDGIAMGHEGMKSSLPSREVIADSVELTVRGHSYDALVGIAGCDKSLPGMMMAIGRLNVPSIFIYGGSILPGTFKGKPVTVQDVFEARSAGTPWAACPTMISMRSSRMPVRRRAAVPSSRQIRWRRFRKRSGWRRADPDENALRSRLPAWGLHDRHQPHGCRQSRERGVESGTGRCPSRRQTAVSNRWRGCTEGQSRAGRRDREDRRHVELEVLA